MSDLDPDLQPEPGSPGDLRQKLADAEARAASAVQEATAPLERALAFAKAGIDVDTPAGGIFARGYDGELTTEAIKEAAASLNLTAVVAATTPTDAAPDPTVEIPADEARLLAAGADLGGAPPPPEAPGLDPVAEAEQVFEKAHADGMGRLDAVGLALNSLANAANRGDQRVIIPGPGSPVPS